MKSNQAWKPFLSVTIVIFTLLGVVFTKMELRRTGYILLKDSRQYKTLVEQNRQKEMKLAQLVQPERIESLAKQRLSLQKAESGQIVQLSGERVALQN